MNSCEPLLERGNQRAGADVVMLVGRRHENRRYLTDRAFDLGIVRRQEQGGLILREGVRQVAATMVNSAERAEGRQVLRRPLQDVFELLLCLLKLPKVQQRAAKRHARRQITGMLSEPAATD